MSRVIAQVTKKLPESLRYHALDLGGPHKVLVALRLRWKGMFMGRINA